MRLGHVRVTGAGLVVHAWSSTEGVCATHVGPVESTAERTGGRPLEGVEITPPDEILTALARALSAYLAGEPLRWDGPLDRRGTTPFQRDVYRTVQDIAHGERRRYVDVAGALGRPQAVRAVGAALGVNPWPVVVPCHRVVGTDGLGGYAAGVAVKRTLLALEAGQRDLRWEGAP